MCTYTNSALTLPSLHTRWRILLRGQRSYHDEHNARQQTVEIACSPSANELIRYTDITVYHIWQAMPFPIVSPPGDTLSNRIYRHHCIPYMAGDALSHCVAARRYVVEQNISTHKRNLFSLTCNEHIQILKSTFLHLELIKC